MKKQFLFIILLFAIHFVYSQDVILKNDGSEINVTVIEITDTQVKYKIQSEVNNIYTIDKSDIFMIKYQNGEKETFKKNPNTPKEKANTYNYPYPPVSQPYQIGDIFDEGGVKGIVFYVYDEGRHGLILSLEETSSMSKTDWCKYKSHDRDWNFDVLANNINDGWVNMLVVEDCINKTGLDWKNFPAFNWCRELGTGWYLPSYNELCQLFLAFNGQQKYGSNFLAQDDFNRQLRKGRAGKLSDKYYRSSTEYNTTHAYALNFSGIEIEKNLLTKVGWAYVRAIHKF